jgi:hypothetical protein
MGSHFTQWADVPAPGTSLSNAPAVPVWQQYAPFSNGWLPITGWLWWPQGAGAQVQVLVDGVHMAQAERGFNRLDVYRAVTDVTDPNVGFRYDLDVNLLAPGVHHVQVVVEQAGQRILLGQSTIRVSGTAGKPMAAVSPPKALAAHDVPGLQGWLDMPGKAQTLTYNPLAREWDSYRASQVRSFLQNFVKVALDAGLPANLAFSHQIVPRVNATWNQALFAVEDTLAPNVPWQVGVNMYGGATNSPWLSNYLAKKQINRYGVPEFNPQQWKSPDAHEKALRAQYLAGARFVSPYYFSVAPERFRVGQQGVNAMEIRPDNPADGSAQFYQAIRAFAAY